MSTLKVSSVQHASAASPAITLDANGQATLNGLAFPTSGSLSGRNRIINGAMEVAQRGTSHTANAGYTLDRWAVFNSGGTSTLSQQTAASGSQPENGMAKFLRITRTSPSGILYLFQRIEDVSLYDNISVTVSFYAKANTNITLPVRLSQDFGSGGSTAVGVGTVNTSITTSFAKYTVTFALPSQSGKTVGTSSFLELAFDTPATYSTLDITGVQLEAGTVATPFERRSYGQELALCQRYYEKSYDVNVAPGATTATGLYLPSCSDGANNAVFVFKFAVPKRAAPTNTAYNQGTGASGTWTQSRSGGSGTSSVTFHQSNTDHVAGYLNIGAAWVVTHINGHLTSDSEL